MADGEGARLGPVTGASRIEVLDILRGIAILGIFYMNIPFQALNVPMMMFDVRSVGWTVADRNSWFAIQVFWEGTQRGLLEFLFGAGMMVLTARVMDPNGPVAVADLYFRRNLWLLVFGLADIFVLLWVGDILHIYAIAAMFLFPFRRLNPKALVAIGLIWAAWNGIGHPKNALFDQSTGIFRYVERMQTIAAVEAVKAKQAAQQPLSAAEKTTLKDWDKLSERLKLGDETKEQAAAEAKSHRGSFVAYVLTNWNTWLTLQGKGFSFDGIIEAFSTMLIGIALWKWRITQGGRSVGLYVGLMLAAYGFGLTARAVGAAEIAAFSLAPKTIWMTQEFARIAVSLGHLALVNLIVKTAVGRSLLGPFKAAGKTAFSIYFLTQFIGLWIIFAPFGLGLWGRYSWGGLTAIATAVIVALLILANVWMRHFAMGPLEWAWRSLSYGRRQRMRHLPAVPDPIVV